MSFHKRKNTTIMIARKIIIAAATLLLAFNMETPMAQAQTQTSTTLPNGASSLNETYQDWVVLCTTNDKNRICVMTQQQRKQDTNQLVLAAEFTAVSKDEIRGTLILPFGLRLADGVSLQVDDGPMSKPLPFSTCLPAGCVVQIGFDAATVKGLRAAGALKLLAKAHDGGQNVRLDVSLKGFAAAQDRAVALANQ
jgi:invasion protein IalB